MQDLYMMCSTTRVRVGSFGRSMEMYKELCSFIASVVGIEPPHPILRSRTPHRLPIPRRIRCRPSYHTRPPPRRLPTKRLLPPAPALRRLPPPGHGHEFDLIQRPPVRLPPRRRHHAHLEPPHILVEVSWCRPRTGLSQFTQRLGGVVFDDRRLPT